MSIEVALCTTNHHAKTPRGQKRPQKATKGHHGYKCHHGMTSISTKYLLENAEVTKNKNDQSNPKNGGQTPKPPMPLAARHWFQRVQNPDPNKIHSARHRAMQPSGKKNNKIHSASKSCSKPKPSTKRVVKFTKSTHMINARVSMSKCTNPCYMTHGVLKARMYYCINQNPGQKITSKPNTEAPQCHWLPATRFQRVQNPDPNKLHNASILEGRTDCPISGRPELLQP